MRVSISLFLLPLFPAVINASAGHSWEVLATGLPERVSTANSRSNIPYYILKQTHEPVFRKSDGQNYSSRILKKWSRSSDYRNFMFCPAQLLVFDDRTPFDFEQFKTHISSITAKYDSGFKLSVADGCVNIAFNAQRKGYLDYLTLYENAPTKLISGQAETGLGPFRVESFSKEKIILSRKIRLRAGYDQIVLHEYAGPKDPNLGNRAIKDFNIIPGGDIPDWVKQEYARVENVELKSINLIINHPDRKIRSRVYNCVDIPALRSAFFSGKKDFFNISNILPMGIPGAVPGVPAQTCDKGSASGAELRFANWMFGNSEAMAKYAAELSRKSGIKIRLDQYSPQALVGVLHKGPRPFNLVIIVFDAVRPDPTAFFESFAKSDGFHDFESPDIVSGYRKLFYADDEMEREIISKELAGKISKQALALPLYQNIRAIYYPKEINNLIVGQGFLEYPEVAEFRL